MVTSRTKVAAGLFPKGEEPQAGSGKSWELLLPCDFWQVTSLDLTVLIYPFQP